MKINDKIYEEVNVEEPVLLELLKSPSVLRLKNISQFGVPDKYYHLKNYSRYEHSIGVMILLKKLGATLEEQVAGLLHDVSVLAFSHVIDWVFANGRDGVEDYHDSIHQRFLKRTEIPKILKKFDFALERIANEKNFSLLEKKIPDLCADRVDYALREFKLWLNPTLVRNCIKGLINYNGEIVFNNQKDAFDFATNFLELQTQHWGGYQGMMRYHLFSEALKIALTTNILSDKDFYKDEPFVLNKVEKDKNRRIKEILLILKKEDPKDIKNNLGKRIIKKFRYVDPKIISNGQLVKLSKIAPKFQAVIDRHKKINQKGLIV
jgi:HD superfamily phosphohydrolase